MLGVRSGRFKYLFGCERWCPSRTCFVGPGAAEGRPRLREGGYRWQSSRGAACINGLAKGSGPFERARSCLSEIRNEMKPPAVLLTCVHDAITCMSWMTSSCLPLADPSRWPVTRPATARILQRDVSSLRPADAPFSRCIYLLLALSYGMYIYIYL